MRCRIRKSRLEYLRIRKIIRNIIFLICIFLICIFLLFIYKSHFLREEVVEKNQEEEFKLKEVDFENSLLEKEEIGEALDTRENPIIQVELSSPVDLSYFNDAVFIGDSRTNDFILYTGLSQAKNYSYRGLNVDTVFKKEFVEINGKKYSPMEGLKYTDFSKVYIMLGVNEAGWSYDNIFIDKYEKIIEFIQAINPSAKIYLQSILPVSAQVDRTHSYLKNEKLNSYNDLILNLAEKKGVYYLNVAEEFRDQDGNLRSEIASDGIHFKKEYCLEWLEYLRTHTR